MFPLEPENVWHVFLVSGSSVVKHVVDSVSHLIDLVDISLFCPAAAASEPEIFPQAAFSLTETKMAGRNRGSSHTHSLRLNHFCSCALPPLLHTFLSLFAHIFHIFIHWLDQMWEILRVRRWHGARTSDMWSCTAELQPDKLLLLLLLWIKAGCVPAADCPRRERTGLLV